MSTTRIPRIPKISDVVFDAAVAPPCDGGRCHAGSVRCSKHAVEYARRVMTERGMVALASYHQPTVTRDLRSPLKDKVVALSQVVQFDCQEWLWSWDGRFTRLTMWVPPWAGWLLAHHGALAGPDVLAPLLIKLRDQPALAQACEAAFAVGGLQAANEVLDQVFPGVVVVR